MSKDGETVAGVVRNIDLHTILNDTHSQAVGLAQAFQSSSSRANAFGPATASRLKKQGLVSEGAYGNLRIAKSDEGTETTILGSAAGCHFGRQVRK